MKRVIKNKKKMKNTMYIVFGVFALALFGITMLNPSYAEEGLIIDDALDAIMQGTEMYGSGGFEKVEEEKLIQPVEDNEGEDVEAPEVTPVEEIYEEKIEDIDQLEINEESSDLDDIDLIGDVEGNEISNTELEVFTKELNQNEELNMINFDKSEKKFQQYEDDSVGQEFTSGCYVGRTLGSGNIELISYDSNTCGLDNVIIPDTIEGRIVTVIGENVFKNKGITSVIFPNTVEIIGTGAFQNSNFSENFHLILPSNLKRIENNGFSSSKNKYYGLNDGLEFIGEYAFAYNYSNSWDDFDGNIQIPNSVRYIGKGAFNLVPIRELNLGTGVEYIGEWAFQDNFSTTNKFRSDISKLIIPSSLKYIGENGFQNTKINKLIFEEGIEEIGKYAFQNSVSNNTSTFTELIIPDSVRYIRNGAFSSNSNLKQLIIGNGSGDIDIGQYAFNTDSITGLIINKENIIFSFSPAFGSNPLEKVIISGNVISESNNGNDVYYNYGGPNWRKTELVLNLTGFIDKLFWDYDMIKNIELGQNITGINSIIFKNYNGETLKIPGNIKYIYNSNSYSMFENKLILEEGIEEIGKNAFRYNYNITGITIPSTVKKIDTTAFEYNYNVETINLNEGLEEIGTGAFQYYNNYLKSLIIPSTVKTIRDNAFQNAYSLEDLTLYEGLESIGSGAFRYISVDEVHVPDSVSFIGKDAFLGNGDHKVIVYVTNDIIPEVDNPNKVEYIRLYKIDFTGDSNLINYPERQKVRSNEIATNPNISEVEGYTFGWYKQGEYVPYDFSTPVTEDIILEAKLSKNSYKVIYQDDNGTIIEEKIVEFGGGIPQITPTKDCNEFSGWDVDLPETMPAHDITLKAIWNYTCSRSSGAGGRKTETTTREIAIDTNTENEHNSADEKENNTEVSEENKTVTNNEISNQVISVTQEVSEDGTVEVVETVKIRNTDIIATVRTEVNPSDSSSSSSNSTTHTKEQKDAYSFAKSNGITTTKSIETAKMDTELTRIEMAKMLSNYAINVLGIEPDLSKGTVEFKDVTEEMDKKYDNAVTKAYQLGIMGQNMNKFRPDNQVTRAEFATALSRLLYLTPDGEYEGTRKYYVPHIAKLYNEGIINKVNPIMKEKRGYVMTMLMRTVQ